MKSQNNSAQNTTEQNTKKPATPKLNPDFSHRLSAIYQDKASPVSLTDTVSVLSHQAISVLNLLSDQFAQDESSTPKMDDMNYWSLQSVIASIKDIKAIVEAYHLAAKAGAK